MSTTENTVLFAPELYIGNGVKDVSFYKNAFDAIEHLCFTNEDGSIHVVEFSIEGAIFHLHEVMSRHLFSSPVESGRTTVTIGLFVPDVDKVMKKAISAGAIEISPAQDYDYGYRQGTIKDPFGHLWQIQKRI